MSIKFKALFLVLVLIVGTFVFSGKVKSASPWDDIWATINAIRLQIVGLQTQITSIEDTTRYVRSTDTRIPPSTEWGGFRYRS